MSEQLARATRLISAVQLEAIRLVEVKAKSRIRSAGDAEDVKFNIHPSASVPARAQDGVFYVIASIDLEAVSNSATEPLVVVKGVFELRYSLPSSMNPTMEELSAFAVMNGVFNAWPYWREFIQSMFVRMNLPPVVLPVYRISDFGARKGEGLARQKQPAMPRKQTKVRAGVYKDSVK